MPCRKGTTHRIIRGTDFINTSKNLFFKNIKVAVNENDCLEWIGFERNGYGRFRVNKKIVSAHRYSYELYKGKIPYGLLVLHKCDNPKCVNPDHLWAGTYNDNNKDRVRKGRHVTLDCEKNGKAKLTNKQVKQIKMKLKNKEKGIDIAREFSVSPHAISKINTGKHWRRI
jgi:hypothetical protein